MLDLGEQYVSDFREDESKPNKYPLVVVVCGDCKLAQLRNTTPPEDMYHENYGFKSGISNTIKDDLKDIVLYAQSFKGSPKSWLDIASNDGTLLSFVPRACYRAGVDPVKKYCKEAEAHADMVVADYFDAKQFERKFDVITAISCFYDMPDPNKFVNDVLAVLEDDGVFVVQQNYLLTVMQMNAVDNTSHEHLEYYSLLSLENLLAKHGLEVFDLETSTVNGGVIRTAIARKGAYPVQDSVGKQRTAEAEYGLHDLETYKRFGANVAEEMRQLKALVDSLNAKGKKIYILAASTRGSTIWQSAGITEKDCPYAVERNVEKVGKYFSAVGIPIISEEQARLDHPDYMLVGPWFFIDEIVEREREYLESGGKFIVPLPNLEIRC